MVIYLLISLTDGIWRIPMILTTPIGCLVNGLLIVSLLKSFEVDYILPRTFTKKYGVENLRLYFNAYNLFTFTDSFLKQFDPEKTEGDYGAGYNYPLTKSFNVGLSVSF